MEPVNYGKRTGGLPNFGEKTEPLEKILARYNDPGVDPLASTWYPPDGHPKFVITIPEIRMATATAMATKDDTKAVIKVVSPQKDLLGK